LTSRSPASFRVISVAVDRQHVKVALSGDGADELFGSYRTHRLAAEPGARVDAAWRSQFVVFSDAEKRELFDAGVAAALEHTCTTGLFEDAFARLTATDPLNQVLEAELKTVLPRSGPDLRRPVIDGAFTRSAFRIPRH
jgi:asparagine synthetase B (glutamine-hydrolysing)